MKDRTAQRDVRAASPSDGAAGHARTLHAAALLMAPVARWLLRNGVTYSSFVDMLKTVFVETARAELQRAGKSPTQSALSVLSGVHRKDVRALAGAPGAPPDGARKVPLPSQLFTRWLTDRRFCDRERRPRPLPRSGSPRSFEALARELSQDVHPRTLLDEMLRLGLVRLDGEQVVPVVNAFVPSRERDELTALFAANAADHLCAAVHNLTVDGPHYLEQSVFADGLGADSVERLHAAARAAWAKALAAVVARANRRIAADADVARAEQHRMRFGVYYFSEPLGDPAAERAGRNAKRATALQRRR